MKTQKIPALLLSLPLAWGLISCNKTAEETATQVDGDALGEKAGEEHDGQSLAQDQLRGSQGDDELEVIIAGSENDDKLYEEDAVSEEEKDLEDEGLDTLAIEEARLLDHQEEDTPPERLEIQVDETKARIRGEWQESSSVAGFTGSSYHHSMNDGEKKSVVYRFDRQIEATGFYKVYANWTPHSNRATNAKIRILCSKEENGEFLKMGRTIRVIKEPAMKRKLPRYVYVFC